MVHLLYADHHGRLGSRQRRPLEGAGRRWWWRGSDFVVGTGTLDVSLTDSAGSYKAVYITIEGVEVHTGGNDKNKQNWETIPMVKNTINLCELTNSVFEELGSIRLDSGKYTQLRLHLSSEPEDSDELNILSELHPAAIYVVL